jgi:hypothetical protein
MVITTLLATFVALHWKHNPWVVYTVNGSLLALDLLFFASTSTKLFDGGWFPLLIAFVISFLMLTWRKGEEVMDTVRLEIRERSSQFIARLRRDPPLRIPGTAIVLGRMSKGVPLALSHNVNCNHVLHEQVLLVAANMTEAPRAPDHDRFVVAPIAEGITRLELRFGFMEEPNIPERIAEAMATGRIETFDLTRAIYYTGHETIIPSGRRPGPAAVARGAVRLSASQRPAPRSVLQDPRLPDHGDRRRIRDLSSRQRKKGPELGPSVLLSRRTGRALKRRPPLEGDRDRLPALRRLDDAHRDRLTFGEAGDAGGAENRAVDEHVLAEVVAGDEAKAARTVKPLDLPGQINGGRCVRGRPSRRPLRPFDGARRVDLDHPHHLRASRAGPDDGAKLRARGQRFASDLAQGLEMHERVASAARQLDEAIPLLGVEPFHRRLDRQPARQRIGAYRGTAKNTGCILLTSRQAVQA